MRGNSETTFKNSEEEDSLLDERNNKLLLNKWNSIKVSYVVMFFTSVSYTIQMPSLWPYMNIIDETYSKHFLGWLVSSYSIGQLIMCPAFSYFPGRTGRFKLTLLFSAILAMIGNYLYSIIVDIPGSLLKRIFLITSRVLIGISASNIATVRLFLTLATTEDERIGPMSILSGCQAIGFIIGPGIQALLVPLGYPGLLSIPFFRINMYTSSGLFSVLSSIVIFGIICYFFKEDFLRTQDTDILEENPKDIELGESFSPKFHNDYISAIFMLIAFFICMGTLAVIETSLTPMTMDNFEWSRSKATAMISMILSSVGLCSVVVLLGVKILTKIIKERILLIIAFFFCLCSIIFLIPMSKEIVPIESSALMWHVVNNKSLLPIILKDNIVCENYFQHWCMYFPSLSLWQFIISIIFLTLGYPPANILSYVIFSKLVSPEAQSLWMGFLSASGSFARIVGPIFISTLYVEYGAGVAFGCWGGLIFTFLCLTPLFTLRMLKFEKLKFNPNTGGKESIIH